MMATLKTIKPPSPIEMAINKKQEAKIRKAIEEISIAENLAELAREKYFSAKKQLESLYSPAGLRVSKNEVEIARAISKRRSFINNKVNKTASLH